MNFLGLDVSTSVIGWTILDADGNYVDMGYINLKKCEDQYSKLTSVIDFFKKFSTTYPFRDLAVYCEEPLLMFKTNASMASTIAKLQRFNGMVSTVVYIYLDKEPIMISAATARKSCGIKVPKGTKVKRFVFDKAVSQGWIPKEKLEYKKSGEPKDHCMDMTDSYIIARAGYEQFISKRQ